MDCGGLVLYTPTSGNTDIRKLPVVTDLPGVQMSDQEKHVHETKESRKRL